jgi:hypothetical protein
MKKTIGCLMLLVAFGSARPAADWRTDLSGYFGRDKAVDLNGAVGFLTGRFDTLSEEDKPVACGMLAYLYGQLGDKQNEYRKLGEYFEKYGALGMGYSFLPLTAQNSVLRYLRDWQLRYPWVLKIGLVSLGGPAPTSPTANPPETIVLGVEMASDVYYKVTDGEEVLKGGQFRRGFNSVTLQAKKLFREPGAFPYILEFKAGDLIVRRELVIGVQMDLQGVLANPAAAARKGVYVLEMFFGDELLASSHKTSVLVEELNIKPPPPNNVYDPWGPGYQNKPVIPSGVPIMAIPAAIMEAIKALKKKDEVEPVPPVELKSDIVYPFTRPNAAGDFVEVQARVSLGLREMSFLSYSIIGRREKTNAP